MDACRLLERDMFETEGSRIDRLALDFTALQESTQGSFLDQDFPPLPLTAHAVMRKQMILAPAVDQAG
jgi:hypothetical protein